MTDQKSVCDTCGGLEWVLRDGEEIDCPVCSVPAGQIPQLLGLTGAAGSGKSTVAATLQSLGFIRLSFARPLKEMMRALVVNAGASFEDAERMTDGDLKEVPQACLGGLTPRHAMQTLGTEWGRDSMAPTFWIDLAMHKAGNLISAGHRVVIDDVRFPNEAAAILAASKPGAHGRIWRIDRPESPASPEVAAHSSERHLTDILPDLVVANTGTLADLDAITRAQVSA